MEGGVTPKAGIIELKKNTAETLEQKGPGIMQWVTTCFWGVTSHLPKSFNKQQSVTNHS